MSAKKLSPKREPELILPNTLKPPRKIIKPRNTFKCIKSLCLVGKKIDINPKTNTGMPSIDGIYEVTEVLPLKNDIKTPNITRRTPNTTEILSGVNPKNLYSFPDM